VIPIRPGVSDHAGSPVGARAVADWLDRVRTNPCLALFDGAGLGPVEPEADDAGGRVRLPWRAGADAARTALADPALRYAAGRPDAPGTGPFVEDGSPRRMRLEAWPRHREGRPYLDALALVARSPFEASSRSDRGGADVVLETASGSRGFRRLWYLAVAPKFAARRPGIAPRLRTHIDRARVLGRLADAASFDAPAPSAAPPRSARTVDSAVRLLAPESAPDAVVDRLQLELLQLGIRARVHRAPAHGVDAARQGGRYDLLFDGLVEPSDRGDRGVLLRLHRVFRDADGSRSIPPTVRSEPTRVVVLGIERLGWKTPPSRLASEGRSIVGARPLQWADAWVLERSHP